MKNIIGSLLVLVAMIFSNNFEAEAQTVKVLQFAKGRSSATVRGTTGSSGVYYNLRVKGGQKMTLNLSPSAKVGIRVDSSSGDVLLREERGGSYVLYFEEGQGITIFVGSTGGRSVPFTLTVAITRMTDI
ncbi:MAG TPA: hypothetical protein VNB22_16025 [Pyrinomonadaceae bacterium]|jgi:hypothetical protein|nr:hypothetical protein [Pyrinomonadaceae bacterium]